MNLYITATTKDNEVKIDFIEMRLPTGEVVSLNWDATLFSIDNSTYEATYKGVYFDEEYANGRLEQLKGASIKHVEAYSTTSNAPAFTITAMQFEDGAESYSVPDGVIEEYYRN